MSTPEASIPIALLSQTGEPSRHLREALAGAGTPIVYEANASQLDREALEQSGARVVVVNLDADVEAHLDEVYALLGDDRYNVIFNEAQVSAQLSGWEQARWARHLSAKILGASNADPPRPHDAQPVPQRAAASAFEAAPIAAIEAEPPPAAIEPVFAPTPVAQAEPEVSAPDTPDPLPTTAVPTAAVDDNDFYDFGNIEHLLEQSGEAPRPDLAAAFADPAAPADAHATRPMPVLDLRAFDADPEPASPFEAVAEFEPAQHSAPAAESLDADPSSASGATAEEVEEALGFGDLDDFAGDPDFVADVDIEPAADTTLVVGDLDFEFDLAAMPEMDIEIAVPTHAPPPDRDPAGEIADSAAAIEAAGDTSGLQDLELLDLDWADAPQALEGEASVDVEVMPPPPVSAAAFAWTLVDEDEDKADDAEAIAAIPSAPADFGIEKITASEYLAPVVDLGAAAAPSLESLGGLSLELVPLEESVAPQAAASNIVRESWLDTSSANPSVTVRRVWVLGASIGGPEAVREFLAHIPQDYPALFLLAQHMGAEFMDLMAQQLTKTSKLTVRTPTHGERVAHGDIVIVPTTHRLRVDAEGIILLEPLGESTAAHSPSIDQVLHDVADKFGARAGVIVFSGMAEDAADGSRYLAGKGGKVYVQDPRTCVISSMVDGVLETGVVGFTGSPRELAERVLGEGAKPAART